MVQEYRAMSLTERRQPAFTAELFLRVGLIWLVVSAIFVISKWQVIGNTALAGADGAMPLAQLIQGPNLLDLRQYQVVSGTSIGVPWSRLIDAPLALVQLALQPLLGIALAEKATLVIMPLLAMGSAMLLAARLARRLFDDQLIFYAILILAMAIPVTGQFQPLRIDHHDWQIVAVLAALNGLTARSARIGGGISGLALGLGVMVGPELLPIAILFGAILARRWLAQSAERSWLVWFLGALALTGLVASLLAWSVSDFSSYCGAFSPAHIAGLGIAALGTSLLGLMPRVPRLTLLLAMGLIGAAALGGTAMLAPHCAAGPFAVFAQYRMVEWLPVWQFPSAAIVQMIVPPLIGLIAAVRLWDGSYAWLRNFWFEYAVLLTAALLISIFDVRAAALACVIASVPLGWQVRRWLRTAQMARRPVARIPAFTAMALAVMPSLPLIGITSLIAGPT